MPTESRGQSGSPVKEGSILQRGMSVDEQETEDIANVAGDTEAKGMPIRQ